VIKKYKSNKTDAIVTACYYSGTLDSRRACRKLGEDKVVSSQRVKGVGSLISLKQTEFSTPVPILQSHYLVKYASGLMDIVKAKEFENEFKRIK